MPDTGYKLDGMELRNSVSTRWSQYGQQMKMWASCKKNNILRRISSPIFTESLVTVHFAVC